MPEGPSLIILKEAILKFTTELSKLSAEERINERIEKFGNMGVTVEPTEVN